MNTRIISALQALSDDDAKALHLAKAANREVHLSNCDQWILCSKTGEFFVSYERRADAIDVWRACIANFDTPIGPEFSNDEDDGYKTFDDVPDEVWLQDAGKLQERASEMLAELE